MSATAMNGEVGLLWSGVLMGLAVAAPLGPVNIEIIRRGIGEGFRAALLVGLGSTVADLAYILIAYAGADPLSRQSGAGRLLFSAGAGVLIFLGLSAIRTALRPGGDALVADQPAGPGRGRQALVSGFVITILNPMTIAFWLGILAAALAARSRDTIEVELLYIGSLVTGCLLWVLGLSVALHFGRAFVGGRTMRVVSAAAGLTLIGFGLRFALRAAGFN